MSADELALLGGKPVVTTSLPSYPELDAGLVERLGEVLRTTQRQGLSKGHPVIAETEGALADFHGVEWCLFGSSGHGALHSALIGLEITGGDHVLTSPYSWGASVSCILHNGAVPVFVDVDPVTGLMEPDALDGARTDRTTAVLVPHLYGQPADMTAINAFAERYGLAVIEDCAQAHGARHRGVRVGAFGDAAGFSTNGVKPLAANEGGYLLSKHADVYWKACISAQHAGRGELLGRASEPGFPDGLRPFIDSLVYTYRPNVLTCVMVLARLPKLDEENEGRRRNAELFLEHVAEIDYLEAPAYSPDDHAVYHMLTMVYDEERTGVPRDIYVRALEAEGVGAVVYVERALNRSPRLSPQWGGPRAMWTDTIRRSGLDPTLAELPGCERKVASSFEIPWNIVDPNPKLMRSFADAVWKIDANLDALRAHEAIPA